jgi:hypothetical protein
MPALPLTPKGEVLRAFVLMAPFRNKGCGTAYKANRFLHVCYISLLTLSIWFIITDVAPFP